MKSKDITHLIFTDVETTGLAGPQTRTDAIVEVAAAKVRLADRVIVDSFQTLIKPHGNSLEDGPVQASVIDGAYRWNLGKFHLEGGHFKEVTWADWSAAMPLDEAMYQFVIRFAEGATFAGQNIPFDLEHIQRDCANIGIPWPETDYHRIDICSPAIFLVMAGAVPGVSQKHTRIWSQEHNRRGMLAPPVLFGDQAHRAMPDVEDAIRTFFAMADVFDLGLRVQGCDSAVCPLRDVDMVPQREPWGPAR